MRPNFALQILQLDVAIGDLLVDFIQRVAMLGELVFARVNLCAGCLLRLAEARDFGVATRELGFKRFELLARMMRIEHSQIGEQRLITARLAGLTLQRADLPLYLFDDVADAQKVRLGRF